MGQLKARSASFLLSLFSVFFIISCAKDSNVDQFESRPEVRAAMAIGDGFEVVRIEGRPALSIQKSALDKEYLFQANLVEQTIAPMGQGLKSRIVAFQQQGDFVHMLEATQGHTVTHALPQSLILSEFPVLQETDASLVIDFNKGMSRLFTSSEWQASDSSGRDYSPAYKAAKVQLSYIDTATINEKNQLVIRQVAQIENNSFSNDITPIAVKYYLEPYRPDPNYKPFLATNKKKVGFFEVSPLLNLDGSTSVYATKFSLDKPITFAISSNTPKEYQKAVKEGILYWNRAFPDKKQIRVEMAPENVSAPDFDYNVIQWVNHPRAGYAYADAQMDPRTGQVSHAQAYITSVFAVAGLDKARRLLKRLNSTNKKREVTIGMGALGTQRLCQKNMTAGFTSALTSLVETQANEAQFLKASQDYVRTVVAHEVGHLLGLRHNFAGSLETKNYPVARHSEIFKNYLKKRKVDKDIRVTSSVMDYLTFADDLMAGFQIAKQKVMYAYDQFAIDVLYGERELNASQGPLFCTDTQTSYTDCNRGDGGDSVLAYQASQTKRRLREIPNQVVEAFIAAKAPQKGDFAKPVESVVFNPNSMATNALIDRHDLIENFDEDTKYLSISRKFPYIGPLNEEEVKEAVRDYVASELQKLGGIEEVLAMVPADYYENLENDFSKLVRSPLYRSGIGLAGQKYEFTEGEIEKMEALVSILSTHLRKSFTKADLDLLGSIPSGWKSLETPHGEALESFLKKRMQAYLFPVKDGSELKVTLELPIAASREKAKNSSDEKDKEEENDDDKKQAAPVEKFFTVEASLPEFVHDLKARLKAADLLDPNSKTEDLDWGYSDKAEVKEAFQKLLENSCNCNIKKVSPSDIKVEPASKRRTVIRWFLANKKVLGEI